MSRQERIHEENVEIRGVIRNNQVRSIRKFHFFDAMYPNQAENSHHVTPNDVNRETPFLPGSTAQCDANKGIKKQECCHEDQPDVQLIT